MQDGPSDEEGFVYTEAEKDALKRKRTDPTEEVQSQGRGGVLGQATPRLAKQSRRQLVAAKGPHYIEDIDDPDEDEEEAEGEGEEGEADEPEPESDESIPNLQKYFDLYDIPDAQVISMCRAYASYLVSLRPKTASPKTLGPRQREKTPPSQKPHWMRAKKRRQ